MVVISESVMARYYGIMSIAILASLVVPFDRANGIPAKPLYVPSEIHLDEEDHILVERRFTMDCETTISGLISIPCLVDVLGTTRDPDGVKRTRVVLERVLLAHSEFWQIFDGELYPDYATIRASHRQMHDLERVQGTGGTLTWVIRRHQERVLNR
jgi:hypothetical protein